VVSSSPLATTATGEVLQGAQQQMPSAGKCTAILAMYTVSTAVSKAVSLFVVCEIRFIFQEVLDF